MANRVGAPAFEPPDGRSVIIIEGNTMSGAGRIDERKMIIGELLRVADKYGLDFGKIYSVVDCESGIRHEGVFGDQGKAYGVAQFHRPTFNQYCSGDYYNLYDQLECLGLMWSLNLESHWACYK